MVQIIRREAMQQSKRLNARAWRFDGADHDFGDVSLFINELALGDGRLCPQSSVVSSMWISQAR